MLRSLLVCAVAVVLVACTTACSRVPSSAFQKSVAVVLVDEGRDSKLVTVDLEKFRILEKKRLRSFSMSIDGDPESRTVVTAQCGGVDWEADDVCGVYRPGKDRAVRYVKMPVPNPLFVAYANGLAYAVHGFDQKEGTCVSVFDPSRESRAELTHLVGGNDPLVRSGERAISPVLRFPGGVETVMNRRAALVRHEGTRTIEFAPQLPLSGATVFRSDDTSHVVIGGRYPHASSEEPMNWGLISLDSSSGAILREVTAPCIRFGVLDGATTTEGLVLCDGAETSDGVGHAVITFDRDSLKPIFTRVITGVPTAVAPWQDKTLVVDATSGELLMFAPGVKEPMKRLKVSSKPHQIGDLVVFD